MRELGSVAVEDLQEVVQELERRRDRADAAGKGSRIGWFKGNSYGLGEAIALLRNKLDFTEQPAGVGAESVPSRRGSCSIASRRDLAATPRPSVDSDGNQQPQGASD